jgi:hypothetical protein
MAKIDIVHLPFRGSGAHLSALIGNEAQMGFATLRAALPHVRAARLRALGIGSRARTTALPEVPTVSETTLPGFDAGTWNGVLAPARTPPPVVHRLNRELGEHAAGVRALHQVPGCTVVDGAEGRGPAGRLRHGMPGRSWHSDRLLVHRR